MKQPRPDTLTFTHISEPNDERCIEALLILFEKKAGEERLCRTSDNRTTWIHGGGPTTSGPSPTTEARR